MELPKEIVLLDSLGDVNSDNICPILVCGSHCGDDGTFARKLVKCNVKAVFLNNAGIGKNKAGIKGLAFYNDYDIIACAVDNYSAEIGVANDTWESGIISHSNKKAEDLGLQKGETVQEAVSKIITYITAFPIPSLHSNLEFVQSNDVTGLNASVNKQKLTQTQIHGVAITVADSITFLNENNVGDILVCGSHGGVSAGEYAQKYKLKAVVFNDAGIGKNNAGIKSLDSLNEAGILACTVDCMSAEIFNGQDVLANGIISVCNQQAQSRNVHEGMAVQEAIEKIGA